MRGQEVRKPHETVAILKLGSWRLAGVMSGPLEALAAQVESAWRRMLGPPRGDMGLYPLPPVSQRRGMAQRWCVECISIDPA